MFKFIYNFLFGNEAERLKKRINLEYSKAIEYQRNGNIREYSRMMEKIDKMEKEHERLQSS